jgi:hypothetical protein
MGGLSVNKPNRNHYWSGACRLIGALALVTAGNALAWGECEYEQTIEKTLDVAGSDVLAIDAAAGSLNIVGGETGDTVVVRGEVCASKERWADEADVVLESGERARIVVVLPDSSGMSWGSSYVSMDLELTVPASLSLDIRDSSGDIEIRDAGAVSVRDSSGDIDLTRVSSASLQDSSGDIDMTDVSGDVTVVQDSSGDIRGREIGGSVVVESDSSGDIRFRNVEGDLLVERDSSGDIIADAIGGDFSVLRDGSGSIRHSDVQGSVSVPDDD